MTKKHIKKIKQYCEINGGATLDARFNFCAFNRGYMVSLEGSEAKTTLKKLNIKILKKYQKLATERGGFIGLWLDAGVLYLDISININNKIQALATARKNKQLAIYDLKENTSIYLN